MKSCAETFRHDRAGLWIFGSTVSTNSRNACWKNHQRTCDTTPIFDTTGPKRALKNYCFFRVPVNYTSPSRVFGHRVGSAVDFQTGRNKWICRRLRRARPHNVYEFEREHDKFIVYNKHIVSKSPKSFCIVFEISPDHRFFYGYVWPTDKSLLFV